MFHAHPMVVLLGEDITGVSHLLHTLYLINFRTFLQKFYNV